MKIAMLPPVEESVPPKKYGGTEVVVHNLTSELVKMGHQVTILGTGDSTTAGTLYPVTSSALRTTEPYASDAKKREYAKYAAIAKAVQHLQQEHFDVVHNHISWRFHPFMSLVKAPVVTTLHGPATSSLISEAMLANPQAAHIAISDKQRELFSAVSVVGRVYNGIDTSIYAYNPTAQGDYLFFLARFSPEKGPKEAIEIAKRSGMKLKMAVKVDVVDQGFFESCKPDIEAAGVEIIGEVGMEQKVELLQNAKALLAPIQWEEPFGLFVTEAMACGTPVIATRRGSFPELITHGETGFMGDTVEELADFVPRIGEISRQACRTRVEQYFSQEAMAKGYITLYEQLMRHSQ